MSSSRSLRNWKLECIKHVGVSRARYEKQVCCQAGFSAVPVVFLKFLLMLKSTVAFHSPIYSGRYVLPLAAMYHNMCAMACFSRRMCSRNAIRAGMCSSLLLWMMRCPYVSVWQSGEWGTLGCLPQKMKSYPCIWPKVVCLYLKWTEWDQTYSSPLLQPSSPPSWREMKKITPSVTRITWRNVSACWIR